MNLNHWCDSNPDRNIFKSVYDPAGNRYDHVHTNHANCSGEDIIFYDKRPPGVVKCECNCHK